MKILRKRPQGSFFALLVKNYIAFTIINILIFIFVVFTGLKVGLSALNVPVTDPKEHLNLLKQEKYEAIDLVALAGEFGRFEIVDSHGAVMYSRGNPKLDMGSYTPQELKFIPMGDDDPFEYQLHEYINKDHEKKTLIVYSVNSLFEGEPPAEGGYSVFNETHRVIESSVEEESGKVYSEREMFFSAGLMPDKNRIEKYEYMDLANKRRFLIIKSLVLEENLAIAIFLKNIGIFVAVFFCIYFLAIIIFVIVLNKKVKKPLKKLNQAFLLLANGNSFEHIDYKGLKEFSQIGASFNLLLEKLKLSERERETLQQEKQRMLADISHDFKTPITAIQGYANAMRDGLISEKEMGIYLEVISQKASKLADLVNLFNEYSQVEHPDFIMNYSEEEICEFFRSFIAQRYNYIVEKGFEIEVAIEEGAIYALIDALQFERALDNILDNVLKHNVSGTFIRLAINESDEYFEIRISDTGEGIPEAIKDTLFKPFIVGDTSRSNEYGSGLGLAISYKIIERHRGALYLNERPESPYKTEFVIRLKKTS